MPELPEQHTSIDPEAPKDPAPARPTSSLPSSLWDSVGAKSNGCGLPVEAANASPSLRQTIIIACIIVATIFLAADLLGLLVDYRSEVAPRPLTAAPQAPGADEGPSDERLAYGLRSVLHKPNEPTEPEPKSSPNSSAGPEQGASPGAPGTSGEPAAPESSYAPQVEATDSEPQPPGLSLQGIMWGDDASIAVLQVGDVTHTVASGDTVGSYLIVGIERNSVILTKDGQTYRLSISAQAQTNRQIGDYPPVLPNPEDVPLPPSPSSSGSNAKASSYKGSASQPHPKSSAQEPVYPKRVIIDGQETAEQAAEQTKAGSSNRLTRREMDEFLAQGAALARDVRGDAVAGDGIGVKIRFRNANNALAKLGIQDEDIILSLNGKTIRSIEELYNSCLTLKDSPYAKIELMRKSQHRQLIYDFPE